VPTTIQLSERTHQRLKALRDEFGAGSFDELLEILLRRATKTPKSRFGAHPEMRAFSAADEAVFDGE